MSSARMSPDEFWLYVARVIGIAVINVGAFFACAALTYGGKDVEAPLIGLILVHVLGFPLMYLLYLPPGVFGPWGRWWGDDSNFIIGLAVLNGLLWGVVLMRLLQKWLRRRAHAERPGR
jgi:hypothetical protein